MENNLKFSFKWKSAFHQTVFLQRFNFFYQKPIIGGKKCLTSIHGKIEYTGTKSFYFLHKRDFAAPSRIESIATAHRAGRFRPQHLNHCKTFINVKDRQTATPEVFPNRLIFFLFLRGRESAFPLRPEPTTFPSAAKKASDLYKSLPNPFPPSISKHYSL